MVEAWHASHGVVKKHRMNSIFEHQNWWNIRNYEIRILNLFHGPIIERSRLAKLFFGVWSMAFPAQCQTIEARDTWRIGSRDFRDCLRRWKAQRRALLPGALEAIEFPIFAPFLMEEKPTLFLSFNFSTQNNHTWQCRWRSKRPCSCRSPRSRDNDLCSCDLHLPKNGQWRWRAKVVSQPTLLHCRSVRSPVLRPPPLCASLLDMARCSRTILLLGLKPELIVKLGSFSS